MYRNLTRRLFQGFARVLLRACGARGADEFLRDLEEETDERRAAGAGRAALLGWQLREILAAASYELKDRRMRPRTRRTFPLLALKLAARSLRRRPAVPLLAAITLGLGYGAAAVIFGVYSGFSRPLPLPAGDDVRWVRALDERGRAVGLTAEDLEALASSTRSFASLGGFTTTGASVQVPAGFPIRLSAATMTADVFAMLGADPVVGRLPLGTDDADGVLLSHRVWQERFAADAMIVGTPLRVDGVERTVLGVMPPGHRFPFSQDLWSIARRGEGLAGLEIVGRLAAGVSVDQAIADVRRVLEGRREASGVETPGLRLQVPRFTEKRGEGGEHAALATLLALVIALVLVSCSNVSNLLLGRALVRSDLLAVHAALGAGPAQVVLQLFCEALLVAASGAMLGLIVAAAGIRYIETTLNGHWGYYWMRVEFEPVVVGFTLALAVLTGVLAGMIPALRVGRSNLTDVLRSDAAGVVGARGAGLSRWLLNGQVLFSCVALIIAILLTSALLRSRPAPGFAAGDIYALSVSLEGDAYAQPGQRRDLRAGLRDTVAADRNVGTLVASNVLPGLENVGDAPEIEGVTVDPDARPARAVVLVVTPPFFELLNIRLLAGRALTALDGPESQVAVVSAGFVREFFGAGDAIGQRLRLPRVVGEEWITVVGVVGDFAAYDSASSRELGRVYLPFAAHEPQNYQLLFTGSTAAAATNSVRAALAGLDPDLGVTGAFGVETAGSVEDVLRYVGRLFETAGVLALIGGVGSGLVALIGLYAALAFEVERRRGEIGERMALGAARRDVLRHVTRTGMRSVAPGLVLGFALSAGFSPLLGTLIGRQDARDPFIYLGVFGAYVLVAVVATLIPGRRAARLDPVRVLRAD